MAEFAREVQVKVEEDALLSTNSHAISIDYEAPIKTECYEIEIKQEPWDVGDSVGTAVEEAALGATPLQDAGQIKLEPWDVVETTLEETALESEPNEKEEKHPQNEADIPKTRTISAQTDYGNAPHHKNKTTSAHHIKTQRANWTESEKVVKKPETPYPSRSGDKNTFKKQTKELIRNESTKTFQCTHCSFSSTRKYNLINHIRTHTGEKPYKCTKCSYSCAEKSVLNRHAKTHTGEKPYKCRQCSYSCSVKSSLVSHMRTHTGEKPYKCTHCSYSCTVNSSLVTHIRTHTGEKPHKCTHCTYSCIEKRKLIEHIRTHTGEKPYKCSHCSYSCAAKSNLINHTKSHRSENHTNSHIVAL